VGELTRVEQAVAFLALLELRKAGEIRISQAAPFAPIRISRAGAAGMLQEAGAREDLTDDERTPTWTARSA
jgi:chromatin segregation and condensation protein Rec8/ScpA/Scc1 (kleisin family)